MNVLTQIARFAAQTPDRIAAVSGSKKINYQQLECWSNRLAFWLKERLGTSRAPLVVYGHKDPMMLVCFLACVKSGHAYCPVDCHSVPLARVCDIVEQTKTPLIFALEPLPEGVLEYTPVFDLTAIERLVDQSSGETNPQQWVQGEDIWYIIFTSGSTGTPKGVQITADCLSHFLDWSVTLLPQQAQHAPVFLNQAPFSFDLSVMDLYTSLALGGTLWMLDKPTQNDLKVLFASLGASEVNVWVSTPSFAELCLADPAFSQALMPQVNCFLFCGETLPNNTVKKLHERFAGAQVVNTYGPTESTVAVTGVLVTPELNTRISPLPVGAAKPGTHIFILDEAGNPVPDGEKGEIIIAGDTVSAGYFARADLTEKSFFTYNNLRAYHTGDEGYLKDGQLYYCGRIDLQIKLHGYRIEIEDIENNILKLASVKGAVVVPVYKDGLVKSLCAYVSVEGPVEDRFRAAQQLRRDLAEFVPAYMIPKKIHFVDSIPLTSNGKADRKALRGMSL